ncbi:MAG: PAS domain S-box protein [Ferruginibacter sp.]
MKEKEKSIHAFLTGGSKMGELIRSFDWSKTALGSPDTWPQTLRIAVRIMLDTPFGMYIAWGNEYIQLYNDGYRPILGATKHPQALGISTRKTFAEIWPTIGPMFEGVMQGTAVGFPDFTLQLDRNGFLEECVFDFSYSPIRLEDGEVGGVLVTVIETTEKVKAAKALQESEQELQFAIEATELATWDLNPATNKFNGNSRLKEWFGLKPDEEIELPLALAVIADRDRDKVIAAIQTAMQFASGGHYDIIYTIIHPQTNNERIVRAKGQASFNPEGIACRFNGTLQDVTQEIVARRLLTESEQRLENERMVLYNSFMNAPAGIAIYKGDTHIYEFANVEHEKTARRKITIGKTVQALFPELEQQGLIAMLNNVFYTGEPFVANEFPIELSSEGNDKLVLGYYNLVIQPLKNENGITERIMSHAVEVTQQVEARKQLEEANQNLRIAAILTENIADAVIATDMNYKTISWNKGAENLYGYASEDMMGKYAMELLRTQFLSDEDKQAWEKDLDASGKWQGEVVQSKKDGTLVRVLVSIAYVYDEDGKPVGAVAVNRDITERKKTEEKIAASENQFRTFADSIQNLAWIANAEGWVYWYNQRWLDYTGLTLEEMQGWGWQKVHHPDHVEKMTELSKELWQKYEAFELTFPLRRYDGEYRWFLTRAYPVKDAYGNIERWIGTNTDITTQKSFTEELETKVKERTYQLYIQNETFKQAEESSMQGSYLFNLTTGKLSYSDNLYRLIGYEPNEFEPSLEEFNKHVHPDDKDYVAQAAQNVLQSKTADEWHYRMNTKNGTLINIKGTGRVIESGADKLLVGTLQDITKDVLAAEALKEKNLILENTNAELASFTYVASHDLKEPLRKIQVFSRRIIETENFSDKTQDYFNRIISATGRMQNLIDSLLDFSYLNSTELVFEKCDLNKLVEEAESDLHIAISEKGAIIEHENLPVIMGVRVQISQLISNLLDNAIKYSQSGIKPRIKITSSTIDGRQMEHTSANHQKKYYAIKFTDNGIGFEQEYANKIFELFQRLHGKNEYSGTGIGLGIVQKIVTNHNGFILAQGKPNIGSTFSIYIPVA